MRRKNPQSDRSVWAVLVAALFMMGLTTALAARADAAPLAADTDATTAPETQPVLADPGDDEPATQPASLPAQALLDLDQLKPAIEKPANTYRPRPLPPQAVPNYGKALTNLEKALEVRPDDLAGQVRLANLYLRQSRFDEAILAFRKALRCSQAKADSPQAAYALFRLADLLAAKGYWKASHQAHARLTGWVEEHAMAYANDPTLRDVVLHPEALLTRHGKVLLRLGEPAEAAKLLERAYRRDRTNRATARLLMTALARADQAGRGDPDRAGRRTGPCRPRARAGPAAVPGLRRQIAAGPHLDQQRRP